jgi:putative ABC transport system substrate-binding protein
MERRAFIVGGCALLASPIAVEAQQAGKVPRIGFLLPGAQATSSRFVDAFRQGLGGYVEGRTILIDYRWAEGKAERLPELAGELVRLKVDVMVTPGQQATLAAKLVTATIPIVMVGVADPVGTGIVGSLARPGANVTGLSTQVEEYAAKWLELLKAVIPDLDRVAVLADPTNPSYDVYWRGLRPAARILGVQLHALDAREPGDLPGAFAEAARQRVGALVVPLQPFTTRAQSQIVELAAKSRLPAIYTLKEAVEIGGLMNYGASLPDMYRKAAIYVDKILKGAKPGDLPVEQPTKFELVINLKTAKVLGITIPQSLLLRADEVI